MAAMRLSLALILVAACGSNKVPHDLDVEQPRQQQTNAPPPLTPVETGSSQPSQPVKPLREPTLVYNVSLFIHTAVPAGTDPDAQLAIANKENEDGILSMQENNASEASAQFRSAVARVPNSVYFTNLCMSLYVEGKWSEGLTSCEEAIKSNPPTPIKRTASGMRDRILWDANKQGVPLRPVN